MKKSEVSAEQFEDAFEVLPPIFISHLNSEKVSRGFAVMEPYTYNEKGAVLNTYWQEGEKFYCCLCTLETKDGRPVNYTDSHTWTTCKAFSNDQ